MNTEAQPKTVTLAEAFQQAMQYHQAGHIETAATIYQSILEVEPELVDALHWLGVAKDQMGHSKEAIQLIQKALALHEANPEAHNNLGMALHGDQQLEEALKHYRRAVALDPTYAQAFYNIGVVSRLLQRQDEAEAAYLETVRLMPNFAEAYFNLGNIYKDSHRLEEAAEAYQKTLMFRPDYVNAHNNLGIVCQLREQWEQAVAHYRQAVAFDPQLVAAWSNMASAYKELDQEDESLFCYQKVLTLLDPTNASAYQELGESLQKQGRSDLAMIEFLRAMVLKEPTHAQHHFDLGVALGKQPDKIEEALACFRQTIALRPEYAEAYNNLGTILNALGRWEESEQAYRSALKIAPHFYQAYANLGNSLSKQGRLKEAEEAYRQGLAISPKHVKSLQGVGSMLQAQSKWQEALKCYDQVLAIDPNYAEAHNNRGMILQGTGFIHDAVEAYRKAISCDPKFAMAHSNLLFAMHNDRMYSAEDIYQESLRWGEKHTPDSLSMPTPTNLPDPEKKLRIGFLSADLREHPVGFFIENVLSHLDKSKVEIYCYASQPGLDALSLRIHPHAAVWRDVVLESDQALAMHIRKDAIDVLIDLNGHTARNRLIVFGYKPAPVQITWMGYFNTTGIKAMDYVLCDARLIPPENEHYFTEKPLRMPDGYLCFTLPAFSLEVGKLPALANGYVTFGCFNYLSKITKEVIGYWAGIMKQVPDSRLFMKNQSLDEDSVCKRYRKMFEAQGVAGDRIIFEGFSPREELMRSYQKVDIALDPFPYNGGTTTVEAIWMGVPVVALSGGMFLSRVSHSILHAANLGDLVCPDVEAYQQKAVALALDMPALAERRRKQRAIVEASPLCNAPLFAKNFEQVIRSAWARWCQEQSK